MCVWRLGNAMENSNELLNPNSLVLIGLISTKVNRPSVDIQKLT